jgi:hypothetical protein
MTIIKSYQPKKAYIIHLGEKIEEKIGETKIYFLPYYESRIITRKK